MEKIIATDGIQTTQVQEELLLLQTLSRTLGVAQLRLAANARVPAPTTMTATPG